MRIAHVTKLSTSTLAVAALFFGNLPLPALAAGIQVIIDGKTIVFTDVQTTVWFATYVRQAAEAGIVSGYKDSSGNLTGKYGPSKSITVAESLKIASEGAGFDADLYGSLVDTDMRDHWALSYVAVAKSENFAVIPNRSTIDRAATRAEVASLFTSAFALDLTNASPVDTRYKDVKTTTKYAAAIEILSRDGILSGDTDAMGKTTGNFRPLDSINRAEVAKMVILARAKYGEPGKDKRPTESTGVKILYRSPTFSPSVLRVKAGTTVTFHNDSNDSLWIASNPHPAHTDLSGFDSKASIEMGGDFSFTFDRLGTFGYHNHLNPSFTGTIIVE